MWTIYKEMKRLVFILLLTLIFLPIKTNYVKRWQVKESGYTIPSLELLKEFGFGGKRLYSYITIEDSVKFTIYPDHNLYTGWSTDEYKNRMYE
jgi:hypothetical protein